MTGGGAEGAGRGRTMLTKEIQRDKSHESSSRSPAVDKFFSARFNHLRRRQVVAVTVVAVVAAVVVVVVVVVVMVVVVVVVVVVAVVAVVAAGGGGSRWWWWWWRSRWVPDGRSLRIGASRARRGARRKSEVVV